MRKLTLHSAFAAVFLCQLILAGVASAQSLWDVVASLDDRQRVVNQRQQVEVALHNEVHEESSNTGPDFPIDWHELGKNPVEGLVNNLGIGDRIAVLNQAIAEFERLKFEFINSGPGELDTASGLGTLATYTRGDFAPLPRVTPENYHEVLRLLGQRVRALRLLSWPVAFEGIHYGGSSTVEEVLDYVDDEPVVVLEPEGATADWKPDSIEGGLEDFEVLNTSTGVTNIFRAWASWSGQYSEEPSLYEEIPGPFRSQTLAHYVTWPEKSSVLAMASGAEGTQIDGRVYIVRRSMWHELAVNGAPAPFDPDDGRYLVAGSAESGEVMLMGDNPPEIDMSGSWVTIGDEDGFLSAEFVEDGYQFKKPWVEDRGDEDTHREYFGSYELKWKVGCTFYGIFKPTFVRGVDASGMVTKLEEANGILANPSADGALLLNPRNALLYGIDVGPGLKGAGDGLLTVGWTGDGSAETSWWEMLLGDSQTMSRFDSSYSLRFAGSASDYHVVYENDRSERTQEMPGLGWPYGNGNFDVSSLYLAWDSPRLRQVAGRDLVADIEYNGDHHGGYTVKVYRLPTSGGSPVAGQALNVSAMTLLRTWTFSKPGGGGPTRTMRRSSKSPVAMAKHSISRRAISLLKMESA